MTGSRFCLAALAVAVFLIPAGAYARGTVRVQQPDGKVEHYNDVALQLNGDTLRIVSADRAGTLLVRRAACSWIGGLEQCLPYAFVLSQHGSHPIPFRAGTLYLNLTEAPHALPHSSKSIEPHGVLALLKTARGTYIAVSGRLDEVKP